MENAGQKKNVHSYPERSSILMAKTLSLVGQVLEHTSQDPPN